VVQNMNEAQAEGLASLVRFAQERAWMPLRFNPVTVGIWITDVVRFVLKGSDPPPEATH
jgi:hypothetical protein